MVSSVVIKAYSSYLQVLVKNKPGLMGQIVDVEIVATKKHCMIGVPRVKTSTLSPLTSFTPKSFLQSSLCSFVIAALLAKVLWAFFVNI